MSAATRRCGAKLDIVQVESEPARDVYGYDLILVRPDLRVVWRGNSIPAGPSRYCHRRNGPRMNPPTFSPKMDFFQSQSPSTRLPRDH
jgi:hypothetical protein